MRLVSFKMASAFAHSPDPPVQTREVAAWQQHSGNREPSGKGKKDARMPTLKEKQPLRFKMIHVLKNNNNRNRAFHRR